jgi:hypothetical protein
VGVFLLKKVVFNFFFLRNKSRVYCLFRSVGAGFFLKKRIGCFFVELTENRTKKILQPPQLRPLPYDIVLEHFQPRPSAIFSRGPVKKNRIE